MPHFCVFLFLYCLSLRRTGFSLFTMCHFDGWALKESRQVELFISCDFNQALHKNTHKKNKFDSPSNVFFYRLVS